MSDQEEYKNGHGREPNKKPDIGRDDVENLIDFSDSDDEEEIEEESEELSGSIEMQVVDEAAQLLAQDDDIDEIEEVPGDLPEVLYEFDPENQVGESLEEQVVVEQQVLDFAEVLMEMVEERYENQSLAEGHDQIEIACDKAEQEPPQQSLMVIHGVENSSNQALEDPTKGSEPSSAALVNERLVPFAFDSSEIDQDGNMEGHAPNDQASNGESSGQISDNQNGNYGPSILGQGANVQELNDGPSRSGSKKVPSESGQSTSDQVRNGEPSISEQGLNNQARNSEPSRSSRGPAVDRNLNEEQSGLDQDLKEGALESSRSGQRALVQNPKERQSRSSRECSGESSSIARVSNEEVPNGGPPRSDKDPIEQRIREDAAACEEVVMELIELEEDEVEVNVQAHPIRDIGIERQPNLEQDIGLRDQLVEASDTVERVDLNGEGGPDSRPEDHLERVGLVAANVEAVALLDAVLVRPAGHIEAAQNEDILLDEQDNLVEEVDGVQILPGPLEGEIGEQENVAAEEPDTAA